MAQWYRALTDIAEEQAHLLAPAFQLTPFPRDLEPSSGFQLYQVYAHSTHPHSSHTPGKHLHTLNKNKHF